MTGVTMSRPLQSFRLSPVSSKWETMPPNYVLVPTGRQRRASSTAVLARGTTPR